MSRGGAQKEEAELSPGLSKVLYPRPDPPTPLLSTERSLGDTTCARPFVNTDREAVIDSNGERELGYQGRKAHHY